MFYRNLSGIVVRIGDICRDAVVLAEGWSQSVSGSKDAGPIGESIRLLFAVGSARRSSRKYVGRIAQLQAECLISGVGIVLRDHAMTLGSYIGQGQYR